MKLFSTRQLAAADKITLEQQQISSLQLMERAASKAYKKIKEKLLPTNAVFKVFCGIGNNGGDGLVIARKLLGDGFPVKILVVEYSAKHSDEFEENLNSLRRMKGSEITFLKEKSSLPELKKTDIVIDAVFGIGLNRPMPDWINALAAHINTVKPCVFAIDMPSGLFSDRIPKAGENVIQANYTLTFQGSKLVFFLPQTAELAGEVSVIDIGLDAAYLSQLETQYYLVKGDEIKQLRRTRCKFSHKGTYGHALVVGGKYGKIGSVVLASKAALHAGSGKVTTMLPNCGYEIMQISLPEAMVITGEEPHKLMGFEAPDFNPEVVCFGMGVGTELSAAKFLEDLMQFSNSPMVIDADGLNLLAKYPELLEFIPENSVLTPHPKELERLIGKWEDDFDKLKKTIAFVEKYSVILVVKGANTLTITEEKVIVNSTGNPGMATAGSGDVLAGIIAGLMAQGYPPQESAVFGVYIHGKAGDLTTQKSSVEALVASDLIDQLGAAFKA